MVSIAHRPCVSGGILGKAEVVLSKTLVFEGTTFFEITKSSRIIERLFLGKIVTQKREMCKALIIDDIVKLRNEAAQPPEADAVEDLGLDDQKPKKKRKVEKQSRIVTVEAVDHESNAHQMKVFFESSKQSLFVELTASNIELFFSEWLRIKWHKRMKNQKQYG